MAIRNFNKTMKCLTTFRASVTVQASGIWRRPFPCGSSHSPSFMCSGVELSYFLNMLQAGPFPEKMTMGGEFAGEYRDRVDSLQDERRSLKQEERCGPHHFTTICLKYIPQSSCSSLCLAVSSALHCGPCSHIETWDNPFHQRLPCPQIQAQFTNCILPELQNLDG